MSHITETFGWTTFRSQHTSSPSVALSAVVSSAVSVFVSSAAVVSAASPVAAGAETVAGREVFVSLVSPLHRVVSVAAERRVGADWE